MTNYIIRRLLWVVVSVLGVITITFAIAYLVPANPARLIAGPHASAQTVADVAKLYGLNQPVPIQYLDYLGRLFQGNLGMSYANGTPVTQLLASYWMPTAYLAIAAIIAELLIGIPMGILMAIKQGTWLEVVLNVLALLGYSLPTFWIGLVLLYFLAFKLSLFPLGGYGGLQYVILPALSVGIAGSAVYARLLRGSIVDLVKQDFVRTAHSKGVSRAGILFKHVIRNALIPFVTQMGMDFSFLLGGLVVTESVFAWPGLGSLTVQSISNLDIPTIMGITLLTSSLVIIFNLIVDVSYAFLDPRISYR